MTEHTYRVIMTGELAEGQSVDEVKARLAKLFKTTDEKIDRLLRRNHTVVKKNTDMETAKKYVQAIGAAGAVCQIEPPAPGPEYGRERPAAGLEASTERAEPRIVPIHLINKEEERFSPKILGKITGSANGMNFNTPELPDIAFNQIDALTAYSVEEADYLLIFIDSRARPAVCPITSINYADFPIKQLPKAIAAFRNFLYFLCQKNPALFLEETTFDFLSGSPLQRLDGAKVEKLATNMGRLIESGDMAAQA